MAYTLHAFIGKTETLEKHIPDFESVRITPLAQGFALIPLTDRLLMEVGHGEIIAPFDRLTPSMEKWGKHISFSTPLAYVEAEYFGGDGLQLAVVWTETSRKDFLDSGKAINEALRMMGVKRADAIDEFDALELGRHRSTEEWIR